MKNVNRLLLWFTLLVLCSCNSNPVALNISKITTEHKINPIGIDVAVPRFSWQMQSDARNVKQVAYQIAVASDISKLKSGDFDIWNSEKVTSDVSIFVPFERSTLLSASTYYWQVKVWDNHGNESPWSEIGQFTTAFYSSADWAGAKWIALDSLPDEKRIVPAIHNPHGDKKKWRNAVSGDHKLPILRKEVTIKKEVKSALVFISGLGHYEMSLNGEQVGDAFLAPGWTDYDSLCLYNMYDITAQLKNGANAFGVMLGNGFYNIPNVRYRKIMTAFGNPKMICKIDIFYTDGSSESVVSDDSWKVTESPITFSSIYSGETFNANLDPEGWKNANFDDSKWQNALEVRAPMGKLMLEKDYPVKLMETIDVKSIYKVENEDEKSYLYDFGQNASGIISLKVKGHKGDTLYIYPGELIDDSYKLLQGATGKPYYFTYICKGDGVETWQPKFTYYGFRYAKVLGAAPDTAIDNKNLPKILQLQMLHNRNSMPRLGQFETSYELFNKVDKLIDWAIKSNLMSVLSDCPHREKLGWLEQAHLMGTGVHYNYDIYHLYVKIIEDMILAQTKEGLVPDIAPEYVEFWEDFRDSPEWGSAGVILPYLLYQWYGDTEQMTTAWDMMTRYVHYLKGKSVNHIVDYGLGDWYDMGPNRPGYAQLTPKALTATASYFYDVMLLSKMATILGKNEEAKDLALWADEIKTAFNNKFYDAVTGVYSTGSQTAIAMPLVVGLVDDDKKEMVLETLVTSINNGNKVLTAGDVGFYYLVKALQDGGKGQLLFDMNARDDVPGYGYQLKKGATALTESWQALTLVSNNHLMLGHIMQWFYSGLGGISQTETSQAYREVKIAPQLVGDIMSTTASYESPYGKIVSNWVVSGKSTTFHIEVPVNCSARIILPISNDMTLSEGGKSLKEVENIKVVEAAESKESTITLYVGSGMYDFKSE